MSKKLFIHIPKNGGMTLRDKRSILHSKIVPIKKLHLLNKDYIKGLHNLMKSLNRGSESLPAAHARWKDLNIEARKKYKSFAIVRNPWDRVVSRYYFGKIRLFRDDFTFEEFLETRFEWQDTQRDYTWHLAVQGWFPALDHVTDNDGNVVCDIIRFENYNEDIAKYFDFPEGTQFDIRNVSNGVKAQDRKTIKNKVPYQELYTPKTIQIVADWYKDDIDTWGFDFDTGAQKNYWNKE